MPYSDTLRIRNQAAGGRLAFTLIELLVVLTVMVSLGGMLTYALASAQTDARIKRTQADVVTLGQLLQTRMNDVALSKMSLVYGAPGTAVSPATGPGAPSGNVASIRNFEANEKARLIMMARRDMMRMVLPECQADLLYPPASLQFRTQSPTAANAGTNQFIANVAQLRPPAQWNQMRSLIGLLSAETVDALYAPSNPVTDPTVDAIGLTSNATFEALLRQTTTGAPTTWTRQHESSECLYLILATTNLFGKKAIDQIPVSRIQDTDGDGVPEVLDAWDKPYAFIRNPVALRSPAVKNFVSTGSNDLEQFPSDPDPLDMLGVDFRYVTTFRPATPTFTSDTPFHPIYLPPVIISSGIDKQFGIRLSYLDEDDDGTPEDGASRAYSSSVVQFPRGSIAPTYSTSTASIPIFRFPDPFFDVSTVGVSAVASHDLTSIGIVNAKQGGGLGAIINSEFAADNITSLDAGF